MRSPRSNSASCVQTLDYRGPSPSPQPRVAVADAAEGEVQGIDVARKALRLAHVDHLLLEQLRQVLVEALAPRLAVAHRAFELLELAVEDVLPHERRGHHDLDDGDAALTVAALGEALAEHRHE